MSGRVAVGVSGSGSNLRALVAAAGRGSLGGEVVLVFADRACAALDWAAEQGIDTILVPGGDDATLADTLAAVEADVVVLAGYLRLLGPAVLDRFAGRILNVHPSLLPAFPGLHGARDALAAGVAVTGVTVHLVDATLDGGPIVAQEAVPVLPDDDEASLLARIHPVEHRLLPAAVAALLAGALAVPAGARRAILDPADRRRPRARPAPGPALGQRQGRAGGPGPRAGRARLGAGLHRRHGAGPPRGRPPGHRRRRRHRLPRDARRPGQDAPPAGPRRPARRPPPGRPPRGADRRRHRPVRPRRGQPVPVRRGRPEARALVRRAGRGDRHRRAVDGPRGRQEPRQRGDRDLARPLRGRARGARRPTARSRSGSARRWPSRRSATRPPTTPGSPPSCRAACTRPASTCPPSPACPRPATRTRRCSRCRSRRSRRCATARTRTSRRRATGGPTASPAPARVRSRPASRRSRARRCRTTTCSTRPPRRPWRGSCAAPPSSSSSTPTRAAPPSDPTLLEAWEAALAGDPVSAFGGVVAVTGAVDRALAERLVSIFLEVVVAPAFDDDALGVLATKPNLRLVVDPSLDAAADRSGHHRPRAARRSTTWARCAPPAARCW